LENLLDSERFYRVNKYDIVALGQVKKLRRDIRGKQRVVLKDQPNTALIVDKNYAGGLREKLKNS
jgi:DNA-binding LytR/AlgR family response regulator